MPLYEYECQECEKRTEAVQKFTDEPIKECSECGGDLQKLISGSSFELRGTGWAKDGYK